MFTTENNVHLCRMAYSDFIRQFSRLQICALTSDTLSSNAPHRWNHYQYEGLWSVGSTAGGCNKNPGNKEAACFVWARHPGTRLSLKDGSLLCFVETFPSNPQFLLRLEEKDDDPLDGKPGCTIMVGLMQKDGRRLGRSLETIGFAIYKVLLRSSVIWNEISNEICTGEKKIIDSCYFPSAGARSGLYFTASDDPFLKLDICKCKNV